LPRTKVARFVDGRRVRYSKEHWELLGQLRERAAKVMEALESCGLSPIVHGSVARGDVHRLSDVDVVVPYRVPSCVVEAALESSGLLVYRKEISQATPAHAVKAHVYLDELTVVTFPLTPLSELEREFYRFGGELTLSELLEGRRVPGVNKRLLLIVPTEDGHVERSILGIEREVAKILRVSLDIVEERKSVLLRRDEVGRTGVFLRRVVGRAQSFEEALAELARVNSMLRRKLVEHGVL